MDHIKTEDVRELINTLESLINHLDLYNAEVAQGAQVALRALNDLEKEVLYAEYKKDCVPEEES